MSNQGLAYRKLELMFKPVDPLDSESPKLIGLLYGRERGDRLGCHFSKSRRPPTLLGTLSKKEKSG